MDPRLSRIWYACIPKKWSILLWQVLKGKIPTDDVLIRSGFSLASRYYCCKDPKEKTIDLPDLCNSWQWWGDHCSRIEDWEVASFYHLQGIVVAEVIWVIWKNRNKYRYEGYSFDASQLCSEVRHQCNKVLLHCKHLLGVPNNLLASFSGIGVALGGILLIFIWLYMHVWAWEGVAVLISHLHWSVISINRSHGIIDLINCKVAGIRCIHIYVMRKKRGRKGKKEMRKKRKREEERKKQEFWLTKSQGKTLPFL